jgi:hypothetical protein
MLRDQLPKTGLEQAKTLVEKINSGEGYLNKSNTSGGLTKWFADMNPCNHTHYRMLSHPYRVQNNPEKHFI